MAEVSIKVLDNGPLYVSGPVDLLDGAGNRITTGAQFALCRCGGSKNKPFCDGTHKEIGFRDATRAAKDSPAD